MLASYPLLSLLPPLVAILLVVLTKKVLPSLGAGIVTAALLIGDFHPLRSLEVLWNAIVGLVWEDGALNWYTILIVTFLLQLGVLTSLVLMAGGTKAFSEWAARRISTRRGAMALPGLMGIALFIDDYFNALAVGQISRPVTDKYRVSRAKLAYIIHSSSAPVVVLAPFSSWGATIIGIIAPILAASALTMGQLEAFVRSAAMNYYAIGALALLWMSILFHIDFGRMRAEERRATDGEGLMHENDEAPGQLADSMPTHESGPIRSLVVPFVLLLVSVFVGMYITGGLAAGSWGPLDTLANADVALSLNVGGIVALIAAIYYLLRFTKDHPEFNSKARAAGAWEGAKSMMPAIFILLFAWLLGGLVGELGTGEFLASYVDDFALPGIWLVPLMFVIAGLIAFSTGTSWGSFGILLPLAGEMMQAVPDGDHLLIASFGAVLAGAVLGDHCSPISDTTILSSTGAACAVPTHVVTQLPYAVSGAAAALVGYIAYAATDNGIVGLITTLAVVVGIALALHGALPKIKVRRKRGPGDTVAAK